MDNKYTNLLKDIERINNHYNEISKLKGENYNIFSVLDVETKENKTHSNFIASLLNPNGEHYLENIFLKLFFKVLSIDFNDELNYKVCVEHSFNKGRIDILIESEESLYIIENKIYAIDQNEQIYRYYEYAKSKNKNYEIFYLTLTGKDASEESRKNLEKEKDYKLISYKNDIVKWLELCQEKTTEYPILRETIKQYKILVQKLTGKLNSNKMENEIKKIIRENYKNSVIIANTIESVKLDLVTELHRKIKQQIELKLPQLSVINSDLTKKWSGISIKKSNWENIYISWEAQPYLLTSESVLGIACKKENKHRNKLNDFFNDDSVRNKYKYTTNNFLCFRKFRVNDDVIEKLSSKNGMQEQTELYVNEILELTDLIDKYFKNLQEI